MVGVVALLVPLVDDEIAGALVPDVDPRAVERVDLVQALAVHPESDPVAFPRHVVARLGVRHEHASLRERRLGRRALQRESARLARGEVRLKDQLVRRSVAVIVDDLRNALEPRARVEHAHVVGPRWEATRSPSSTARRPSRRRERSRVYSRRRARPTRVPSVRAPTRGSATTNSAIERRSWMGERHCRHRRVVMSKPCMSANSWFSPPIAQQKV